MAGEHQPDVKLFGKWGFDDVEVRPPAVEAPRLAVEAAARWSKLD